MKILCPTDFSHHSNIALKYGVDLANDLDAEIHILSVIYTGNQAQTIVDFDKVIPKRAKADMNQTLGGILPLITTEHLPVNQIMQGFPEDAIITYAEQKDIDLIVLGTQSHSKLRKLFLGSVARKVSKRTKTPILIVPEEINERNEFARILLALDEDNIKDANILSPLLLIAKTRDLNIDVYHAGSKLEYFPVDPIIDDYLGDRMGELIVEESFEPTTAIKEYAMNHPLGMLVMLRRKKKLTKRLFSSSMTAKEIGITNVPLLLLPE